MNAVQHELAFRLLQRFVRTWRDDMESDEPLDEEKAVEGLLKLYDEAQEILTF